MASAWWSAQAKFDMLTEKLRLLKKEKKLGIGSEGALTRARYVERAKNGAKLVRSLNPNYKISLNEVAGLQLLYRSSLSSPIQAKKYPIEHFLEDYAAIRFGQNYRRPRTEKAVRKIVKEAIRKRFGRVPRLLAGLMLAYPALRFSPNLEYGFAESTKFFDRLEKENRWPRGHPNYSLQKNVWNSSENQRKFLELAFREFASSNYEEVLRQVRRMENGVVDRAAAAEQLAARIKKFELMDQELREELLNRNIQESHANSLGNTLTELMLTHNFFRDSEYEQAGRVIPLDRTAHESLAVSLGLADGGESPYLRHLRELLSRPGNRQFIAQKAIEFFGRKKKL